MFDKYQFLVNELDYYVLFFHDDNPFLLVLRCKFASLVNKKTCLEIAKKIELDKYILTFNLRNKKNLIEDKVLSDSCEALIGSIYLDQGFQIVEKVILNLWSNQIKNSIVTHIDAKTKLQ